MNEKALKYINKELNKAFGNLEHAKARQDARATHDIKQKIDSLKYIKIVLHALKEDNDENS